VYVGLKSIYNYNVCICRCVHVSVHVVVGILWHCEGAPPHLKRAICEQGKTCNYYHEIRWYSNKHNMYNNSPLRRAPASLVHINEISKT